MNRNLLALTFVTSILIAGIVGYSFNPIVAHKNPAIVANVEITENVGGVTAELYSGNVITDIGENYTGEWLGLCGTNNNTARNGTQWISLSDDASPVDTWTKLANEANSTANFTRALGTLTNWTNSGDYAFNVSYTFTANATQTLQTAGLQWSGVSLSDNNLFACAAFTQTTFNSGDTLTVKWSITINAND